MTGRPAVGTVGDAVNQAAEKLRRAEIETARLDARVLMAHVLGRDQAWLIGHGDDPIAPQDLAAFEAVAQRRAAREPVAYLTGEREFWSLPFQVTPDTLIPRPDSETLVEAALENLPTTEPRLLDLGTGTGCLLLAVLSETPDAHGVGIDASAAAAAVATGNARRLGLAERASFRVASWSREADWAGVEPVDMVIANPPYIPESDLAGLADDVRRFEPTDALNGGADGLRDYREIAARLPGLLAADGVFIGEFGLGQGPDVAEILRENGLHVSGFRNDAAEIERCVIARRQRAGNS